MMVWQLSVPSNCRNIEINVRGSIVDLSLLAVWYTCKGVLLDIVPYLLSAGLTYRWSYLGTKDLALCL